MPELPASVRVAVWTSFAWSVGADAQTVLRRALPHVDVVVGLAERLTLWRELGEQSVYAALPRPGALGLLPRCSPEAVAAAAESGEAVFVAGVGGLAVPRLIGFGTESSGLAARWENFDADPVAVHRLAGVDVVGADRELRTLVHATTEDLGDGGWVDAWQRGRPGPDSRAWSLPEELPDRVRGLILRAGSVLATTQAGLDHAEGSASAHLTARRRGVLLPLRESATRALESAACAAAAYFAAQSRSTRS